MQLTEQVFSFVLNCDIEYIIGDVVYLITDIEQHERMVVGVTIRPSGVIYILVLGTNETAHYGCEISKERNIIKLTS